MKTSNAWLRVVAAAVSCALASCGGGGGGSGGGSGINVTANASSFQLVGIVPATSLSNTVTFTLSGGNGQTLYAGATSALPNLQAQLQLTSDTQAVVTLTDSSGDLSGSRTGTVTFELCSDANCQHVVWSHDYPVTSTRFRIASTPLTLAGSEGSDTTASLAVTPPDTGHLLTIAGLDMSGFTSWLNATHDSAGNITLTASAASLAHGSYAGMLTVRTADGSSFVSVPVSFTVGLGLTAPALADIVERVDSTGTSLQGSASIGFVGRTGPWTASSDTPWLVVDTPAGTGTGLVSYHVDPVLAHAAVGNWASGVAHIAYTSPGMTTVSSQVTFKRQLPEVAFVTPSQVWPGQAATVRVTGRGLSQLDGIAQIRLGGQAAPAGAIDSDTQATLVLPARAASSVQVSVDNAMNAKVPQANLVVAAGRLPYAALPNNGPANAIVYDPSRQAVFVSDNLAQVLQRWQWNGNAWTLSSQPWGYIWRVQLSPDRQTLYVLTQFDVTEVDPDTLETRASYLGSAFSGFSFDEPMPITLDQRLWMPEGSGRYFDLGTHAYATLDVASFPANGGFNALQSTPDGSHLFLAQAGNDGLSSNGWYAAATQRSSSLPAGLLESEYRAVFDLDGGRGLFEWQWVYDTSNWTLAGTATLAANEQGVGGVISPDGTRVYRLAGPLNASTYASDHLDVFDATRVLPGTSQFPLIGTIPVPDGAVNCSGYYCDIIGRLAIDALGSNIFWVGNRNFVVIPIPQGLAQPASAGANMRRLQPAAAAAAARR